MPALNRVQLIGRLGKDPEMQYTPNGTAVTKASMAVSERRTTKDGQNKEYTEWVNLEAWSGLAETMSKYLKKGSLIYAEGRLKTDSYDKDGEKRYFVKVVLSKIEFLDKKEGNGNGSGPVVGDEEPLGAEDEIPF